MTTRRGKTPRTPPATRRRATRTPSGSTRRSSGAGGREGLALLIAGQEHFATYPLPDSGSVQIGRSEDNLICIEDLSLSRHHAVLHVGEVLSIEDCGSANGTRVRNHRLAPQQPTPIDLNEAVVLGSVTVIVQRRRAAVEHRALRSNDYFEERLYDECARAERYGSTFSIAHLRLDRPLAREEIQTCLADSLRPSDIVGVYGPQEYDLMLLELDSAQAHKVLARVQTAFRERGVKARAGVAAYGVDGRTPGELAASARAQTREKRRGKETTGAVVLDPAMVKIHELARRIAATEIVVLLLGETGVGKEILAEQIHTHSPRARGPFLRLNCSALSQSLLESELFGHERGAFTGASKAKPGLLEVADRGTVFLDEVGEMPLETQVKLLRVLEERKVTRVGGTRPLDIDVRFVAATHRDLEAAIDGGRFREDLFYRLNAFSIMIPPLRDRPTEIAPLAQQFIARLCDQLGRLPPRLSPHAIELLTGYSWPGNVRELRNVVERAAILARGDSLTAEHLPDKLRAASGDGAPTAAASAAALTGLKRRLTPDEEKQIILKALEKTGGNQTDAAAILGVSRRTLMNKLDRHRIARPRKKGRA